MVVPFLPRQQRRAGRAGVGCGAAAADARRWSAPLQAHRRAVREHLAHVDALRAELEARGLPTELLDGEQVVRAAVGAL